MRRSGAADPKSLQFDVVVIDEAAQALEVGCWIPLLLGKKAVLAGDHQQLSACVKSATAQQQGLDQRLRERCGGRNLSSKGISEYHSIESIGWISDIRLLFTVSRG